MYKRQVWTFLGRLAFELLQHRLFLFPVCRLCQIHQGDGHTGRDLCLKIGNGGRLGAVVDNAVEDVYKRQVRTS